MSEAFHELADIPKDFVKDGLLFVNRCTKPDKREFLKISQAVGFGFLIMGAIGYFIKLSQSICSSWNSLEIPRLANRPSESHSEMNADDGIPVHIPVNNILMDSEITNSQFIIYRKRKLER
ncbi:hypothetical protein LOZ58_004135 [Ophidiomyces ophidiicola]|nr:hypothetical protein LOZ58_004135 [Ophidiomyces ophidiicola]